jgi:hypothetical protein
MLDRTSGALPTRAPGIGTKHSHQTLTTPGERLDKNHLRHPQHTVIQDSSNLEQQGDHMRNWIFTGCAVLLASVLTACPPTATKPVISTFTATPDTVTAAGTDVTLAWTVTGATDITISGSPEPTAYDPPAGTALTGTTTKAKAVKVNTTFTLTAKNATGTSTQEVKVTLPVSTVVPTITSSVPANNATGVAITNDSIEVTFDKAMDKAATQGAFSSTGITAPTFAWSNVDKTLKITSAALANTPAAVGVNKVVNYTFSNAAKSADGAALAAVTQKYTTKKAVLVIVDAAVTPAATSLSGSAIFTDGTGVQPTCATPCPLNSYEAEIRAGDNNNSVKGDNPATTPGTTSATNYAYKGFIGFNLPVTLSAVAPADVISAKVTASQLAPIGTPYVMGTLKLQSITSADLSTKFTDTDKFLFYVAPFTGSFDFSTDGTVGSKSAVVTSAVVADLTNKATYANRSLFRMIFPRKAATTTPPVLTGDNAPGDTDGDNALDVAVFQDAKLEVVYSQP